MCTAVTYHTIDHYFGRTLDYEFSYHETITITPRYYPFHFRKTVPVKQHYALIGMAMVLDNYPLYYDATNEMGLSMAGLNFPGCADYKPFCNDKDNITPFEFIPWILSQCAVIPEVKYVLEHTNLVDIPYSEELPLTPLHWIISDKRQSITVECTKEGLFVYDNPIGILTNSPPFDFQMLHLCNYLNVTNKTAVNRFSETFPLTAYSRGMGGMGLPGDLSSSSRFVKAAFTKLNSFSGASESESISQFFHILGSVAQQRGCVQVAEEQYEITLYTSCCNVDKGIYYYTTYENSQISGVNMHRENLDQSALITYPLIKGQKIHMQN